MDIDALLEAFQDFEKKGKKETCLVPEQFLCHVAKTGQPVIPWSQFKTYFMFKLEKVMEDFHASTPEQRGPHNPNVEYVPFEEMKKRILKIVDGYSGIPFTIQRLCELLTDPKRNYTGIEKFLRGLEKNVMVVSCVYPTSEKNGACSVNRMNGVMFPGNSSLFSDSRNVNGPATPKLLNRPKLSSSASLSTNGLPDCPISKESEPTTDDVEEQPLSDSSPSVAEMTQNSGMKNKHPEEEDSDADKQEVKRLKLDSKEEVETKCEEKSSLHKGSENLSETMESSQDACGEEYNSGALCDTTAISKVHEPSSTQRETSETEEDSSGAGDVSSLKNAGNVDQLEQPVEYENIKRDNGESSHTDSEESLPSSKKVPCSSPDLSTEGNAYNSNSTETSTEPEEHE